MLKKYNAIHQKIRRTYGRADHCENPKCSGKSTVYWWSSKEHNYDSIDRKDWQQLCCLCHADYDITHNGKFSDRCARLTETIIFKMSAAEAKIIRRQVRIEKFKSISAFLRNALLERSKMDISKL